MSDDDDSDASSHSSANIDSMTDAELKEWHRRKCEEEGVLWSHAFDLYEQDVEVCGKRHQFSIIRDPRHRVVDLFREENWRRMGAYIHDPKARCEVADLDDCGLTDDQMEMLFGMEKDRRCPLQRLSLSNNSFGPRGIAIFLQNSSRSMKVLQLDDTNLGFEGARLLSDGLNDIIIENLGLASTQIGGGDIERLLSATNSARLEVLYIQRNAIGRRGVDAVARFLGRDDTGLKKLTMPHEADRYASIIFESISRKSKLEELRFWDDIKKEMVLPEAALPSLQRLVCDTRSFQSIIESNHQLKYASEEFLLLGFRERAKHQRILGDALSINKRAKHGASVAHLMRAKLRTFYFSDPPSWKESAFDVQPFLDMDVALMPNLLQLVTRIEASDNLWHYFDLCTGNLGSVYRLIKNCQTEALFSFTSGASRTTQLEAEVAGLRKQNDLLHRKIEELQGRLTDLPGKRAKLN